MCSRFSHMEADYAKRRSLWCDLPSASEVGRWGNCSKWLCEGPSHHNSQKMHRREWMGGHPQSCRVLERLQLFHRSFRSGRIHNTVLCQMYQKSWATSARLSGHVEWMEVLSPRRTTILAQHASMSRDSACVWQTMRLWHSTCWDSEGNSGIFDNKMLQNLLFRPALWFVDSQEPRRNHQCLERQRWSSSQMASWRAILVIQWKDTISQVCCQAEEQLERSRVRRGNEEAEWSNRHRRSRETSRYYPRTSHRDARCNRWFYHSLLHAFPWDVYYPQARALDWRELPVLVQLGDSFQHRPCLADHLGKSPKPQEWTWRYDSKRWTEVSKHRTWSPRSRQKVWLGFMPKSHRRQIPRMDSRRTNFGQWGHRPCHSECTTSRGSSPCPCGVPWLLSQARLLAGIPQPSTIPSWRLELDSWFEPYWRSSNVESILSMRHRFWDLPDRQRHQEVQQSRNGDSWRQNQDFGRDD